jgi:hypothetical protein
MKTMRIVDVLFLLATLLGLPVGYYVAHQKYIDNEKAAGMLSEEATVDDFAKKEFLYADPQRARNALAFAIKIHQDMQVANPSSGAAQRMDLGWCYAELALLEESGGSAEAAKKDMAQAVQTLRDAGASGTTEFIIRQKLQPKQPASTPADATSQPATAPQPGAIQSPNGNPPSGDKQS